MGLVYGDEKQVQKKKIVSSATLLTSRQLRQ